MSHKNSNHNNPNHPTTTAYQRLWWWAGITFISVILSACRLDQSPQAIQSSPSPLVLTQTPTSQNTPTRSVTPSPSPTLGVLTIDPTPTLATLNEPDRLAIFETIWRYVDERYVYDDFRGVDWNNIKQTYDPQVRAASDINEFYRLVKEMIALLNDDHTRFDTPQEVAMDKALYMGMSGYAGVGITVRTVDEGLMIVRLARSGPAEMAGVKPYDIITSVDGVSISAMMQNDEEYTRRIRGPIGSLITLGILRDNQQFDIQITRNAIPSDAFPEAFVQPLPQQDVVFLTIDSFNRQNLDGLVRMAIDQPDISQNPHALIIDVRENYGGSISAMLNVMGLFQSGGVMGEQVGRDSTYTLEIPRNNTLPNYATIPIVILTSGETASAAEMFASGMRSTRGARIIGQVTAGNTENLYPYDLDDGSTLWLAELLFRQNDGTFIDDIGIQPDIIIDAEWGTFKPQNDPYIIQALADLAE